MTSEDVSQVIATQWSVLFPVHYVRFEFDGRNFFSIIRKVDNQNFYHMIFLLGSPNEAKNYTYRLEFYAYDTFQRTCAYTDQVIPVDETSDSIIESFNCFEISHGMMKARFIDKDGKFKYSVQIRNLEGEVKDLKFEVESGISDDE